MSHENKCPKCGKGSVPIYGGQFHVCSTFVRMDGSGGGAGTDPGGIDGSNQDRELYSQPDWATIGGTVIVKERASEVGDEEALRQWILSCEVNPKYPSGHYELVKDTWAAASQHGRLSERAKHEWKNVDCRKEYRKSKLMEDKDFCHGVIEGLEESFELELQRSAALLSALKEAREICRTDSTDTVNIHGVSVCSKAIQSYERGVNE